MRGEGGFPGVGGVPGESPGRRGESPGVSGGSPGGGEKLRPLPRGVPLGSPLGTHWGVTGKPKTTKKEPLRRNKVNKI